MTAAFGKSIIASLTFVAVAAEARVITLKPGVTEVSSEYVVGDGDTLRGARAGSILRASAGFQGRAILSVGSRATVERLTVDGNRTALKTSLPIAPHDRSFVSFYPNNGIVSVGSHAVIVRDVTFRRIASFAVLVSDSRNVLLERLRIEHSGSLGPTGRNNTTGGILLEEGTTDFVVRNCSFQAILGNGIWTHSRYTSERNARGRIVGNRFDTIGRDAIQVGHATEVQVSLNRGARIGYPRDVVDMEGGGMPVAIDTAGNVDKSSYDGNNFREINGKCIDLDGFHDGDVRENTCTNRYAASAYPFGHYGIVFNNTNPDMQSRNIRVTNNVIDGTKFGGIFVIGHGHTVTGNSLLRLNLAGCNESHTKFGCIYNAEEPNVLQTGIYLGRRAERLAVAHSNTITGNLISGFKMAKRCIDAAPGVELKHNVVKGNECKNQ